MVVALGEVSAWEGSARGLPAREGRTVGQGSVLLPLPPRVLQDRPCGPAQSSGSWTLLKQAPAPSALMASDTHTQRAACAASGLPREQHGTTLPAR